MRSERRALRFAQVATATTVYTILQFSSVAGAAEIESVFPTGSVKQVQQVTARFSTDMVAMGDPRSRKDPFTIGCAGKDASQKVDVPKGSSRWIDAKNWSYDFAKPLGAGIKCSLKFTGTKDFNRESVTGLAEYTFSTGGPAILNIAPRYADIEPNQFFILETDGPIDIESIKAHAYFESDKLMSRIGVKVIDGRERETVLRSVIATEWQFQKYKPLLETKKPLAQIAELNSFIVLAGKNRFAESSKVVLHWPKEIKSASGIAVDEVQQYEFNVIPPFAAKFTCERVNPERPCNPILNMRVEFSSPVDRKLLTQVKLSGPKGVAWTPVEFDKSAKPDGRDNSDYISALTFAAPFPDQSTFKINLPKLKDELGRALVNQEKFPLEVKTDDFTPLVKFAAPFGILERNADPILPVSLRNVEKTLPGLTKAVLGKSFTLTSKSDPKAVIDLYRSLHAKDESYERRGSALLSDSEGRKFVLPKPGGERDFELVGIPLKTPGFHVVELQSPRLGKALLDGPPMFVASGALVTNLSVHFKKGRESSAVWVTTLDQAKPVANAEVSLLKDDGTAIASGRTDASGIWRVANVDYPCGYQDNNRYGDSCEVFAFAKSGDDMSFVSNRWSRGIEEYRFNLSSEYIDSNWGPVTAHAVLDRSLIQAGETLHIKTYLREYTEQGFKAFSPKRVPKRLLIVHRGSNKTFAMPFVFDAKTGTAIGEFKVPKDATLGFYEIYLSSKAKTEGAPVSNGRDDEADEFDWSAKNIGNFIVAEYRLPMMESTVKIQGSNLVRPKEVKVDLSAHYLSGGPAKDLKVKVRSSLTHGSFTPDIPNATEYTFFSRPVKTGTTEGENTEADADLAFVFNQDVVLGATGGILTTVKGIPASGVVRTLIVEAEYRDPNGETKTGRSDTLVFPSETIVGLRSDSWLAKAGKASVAGIIVTPSGKPAAGKSFVIEAYRQDYITHRKRLVGGFYSYDSSSKTVALGKVCDGKSDDKGEFRCEANQLPSGSVTLQARVIDSEGRSTVASVGLSIYEEGDFSWWTPSDSDRVDLIPEKTSYQPGETAKFVLRSPFPLSTVLVTVEREGVLDAFVRNVSRDNPVIEVPLKGNFAPNVFVSALALRGRVGDPQPTALIDLAKPAMKLGISEIKVGWKAHELKVTVTPEKKKYRAREKAFATVRVVRADGAALAGADTEIAIVVIDEAIAQLRKNWSVDLLSGMMRQRPLAVDTSSAQNQIIGKRHFGSKAKPPGGGGGSAGPESRELFDPLLLWLPHVKLDAKGEAKITIPLNDSITSFRIAAIAHSGMNFFGSGSALIQSSKDIILYSGFAPVVRDGDQIKNQLTVRNTTAAAMKVDLSLASAQLKGLAKPAAFDLRPSESKVIEIPVDVPGGLKTIEYTMTARDSIGGFSDSLKITTRVDEAVPAQVLQATLFQLTKTNTIPVAQPKDAIIGRGGLAVESRATLLTGLGAVKSYMEDYPYSCLEQKVSKAVALEIQSKMKDVIQEMPAYLDGRGLLKFFPSSICGSAQLSRYVLQITKANGYEIPIETRDRVLDGLDAWLNGRAKCFDWWESYIKNAYLDQERMLAMEALSEFGRFKVEMLKTINVTPNLWKTSTVVALGKLVARETAVPNRDALLKQTENIIRSRVNYQGSLMNLQGDLDWEAAYRLFSSRDTEAIAVFGLAIDHPAWQGDAGKLARGITARFVKGKWDTTIANAWGVTELRRFAAKFEKDKVAGATTVKAPSVDYTLDWAKKSSGEKTLLAWPTGSEAKPQSVAFTHQGLGKPWVLLQTKSAIPLKTSLDMGYSVVRKVTRVSQDGSTQPRSISWKNGDVANVELTITAKYDHPWVVVRDPIPAGASHLGTGLEGGSSIMDRAPKARPSADQVLDWPSEFEEKSQSHFVSYAAFLMKGTYKTNYRIRLNSAGSLKLPPTHIEALYSPETFGDTPIAPWTIAP